MFPVWEKLMEASDELGNVDTYRFDLVHISREALASLTVLFYQQIADAFQNKDSATLKQASDRMNQLIRDLDHLLGTHDAFLLGYV